MNLIVRLVGAACIGGAMVVSALPTPAMAQNAAPAWAQTPVTTVEGISEYRLPNGLRVLLFPDDSAANVTVNITYFVGSRHEGRGEKGMAHLLEHMVFKGTPTFSNPWKSLQDHGADFNGTTWTDRTNYYETMVASDENLDFALGLEADRMVNSFIDADVLATEMTVVRNEFEMGENSPFRIIMKELADKAYTWHPYGNSTIGNRSDIERVPADNLRAFYKHYYRPGNAMLVVAGKFEPAKAIGLIDRYFAPLTNPEKPIDNTWTDEPTQDGPRFVEIRREGSQASVGLFYHTPAGSHEEAAAIELLADVLGNRPSGRLYKGLVEAGHAASVTQDFFAMAERGGLMTIAVLKEGQDPHAALSKAKEIVEGLKANPITDEEVERARTKFLKNFRIAMADSNRVGVALTEAAANGDWRLMFLQRDRVQKATTADVNRVAQKYLIENNRTAAAFIPTKNPVRAEIPDKPDVESLVKDYKGQAEVAAGETFEATPANIEARVVRTPIGDNIELAMLPKETRGDQVNITMTIRFGDEASLTGRRVVGSMAPAMMRRGAGGMTYQQLNDAIDKAQSQVSVGGGAGSVSVSIVSDREHAAEALNLARAMLREPSFDKAEFDNMLRERIAGVEASRSEPRALLGNALQRAVTPFDKTSIHYVPTIEESIAELQSTTVDDVKAYYANLVGPAKVEVAAVGDFEPAQMQAAIATVFDGWQPRNAFTRVARPYVTPKALNEKIATPDKPMGVVARGTAIEMSDTDPDYPALELASYVLGSGGTSRLNDRLRQKDGLSYGAGGRMISRPLDPFTTLTAQAICASPNAEKAMAAMNDEFDRWINEGVTQEELDQRKASYRLEFLTGLADDGNVAGMLSQGLYLDRTMKWDADMLAKIEALTVDQVNGAIKRRFSGATWVQGIAADPGKGDAAADEAK